MKFVYPAIDMVKTGQKLRSLRIKNNYSVQQLAILLGDLTVQAIYKWEKGYGLPSIDNFHALSRLYNVAMDDMIVDLEAAAASFFYAFFGMKERTMKIVHIRTMDMIP